MSYAYEHKCPKCNKTNTPKTYRREKSDCHSKRYDERCHHVCKCYDCDRYYQHHCHEDENYSRCDCFSHRHHTCDRLLCSDEFRFLLGGLQGGLAFRLRQLIGCKVKMKVECNGCEEIEGKISFVGKDWVELEMKEMPCTDEAEANNNEGTEEDVELNDSYNPSQKYFLDRTKILPFETVKWVDVKDHQHHCKCNCCDHG